MVGSGAHVLRRCEEPLDRRAAGRLFLREAAERRRSRTSRVVYVAPRDVLRLSGGLGPLQASGVAGSMTWKLTGDGDNTRVQLSYSVGGFIDWRIRQDRASCRERA